MSQLFLFFYNFFNKHRVIFILLIVGIVFFAGYFSFQLELEEDITKMMPADEKVEISSQIIRTKFIDKLIVNISLSDTSVQPDPDRLISYTNDFVDILQNDPRFTGIREITYKIPEDLMYEVYNTFYENMPVFLEQNDYKEIDSLISESGINNTLKRNYKTLVTPAGVVLKKFIIQDPIGLTSLALKKLQTLQFDENYEIHDGYILTKDKKNLLIFITSTNPFSETSQNAELLNGIDDVIDSLSNQAQNKNPLFIPLIKGGQGDVGGRGD
ncbi:MAG: hypothetical protein ABII90_13475, partial [Bacteroidota bacterium]